MRVDANNDGARYGEVKQWRLIKVAKQKKKTESKKGWLIITII